MDNFVAIGNDELGAPVNEGDVLVKGNLRGKLELATVSGTGEKTKTLGVVTVDVDGESVSYVACIAGSLAFGWEHEHD